MIGNNIHVREKNEGRADGPCFKRDNSIHRFGHHEERTNGPSLRRGNKPGGITRRRPMDPPPERDGDPCTRRHHKRGANGPSFR